MKNYEELIVDASVAISDFHSAENKGFDLFFSNGVFFCHSVCHADLMSQFIRHFSVKQASAGLTGPQWLRLGKKAAKLQSEN